MKRKDKPLRPACESMQRSLNIPAMPSLEQRQREYQEMLDKMTPNERQAHFEAVRRMQAEIDKDRLKYGLILLSVVIVAVWIAVKVLGWLWRMLA